MSKIVCICLSATIQKTIQFENLQLESVNRSKSYIKDAAGKSINSARVLNQLEPQSATAVCPLGKQNANEFIELAEKDGINLAAVKIPGFTRECLTLLDTNKHSTTELVVSEPKLQGDYSTAEEELLFLARKEIEQSEAVILAGSRPEIWSAELYPLIAKIAKTAGKIFLADYCGKDLTETLEICIPDIIKINEEEFAKTFRLPSFIAENELKEFISSKSKELNNIIIVTRGTSPTFAAQNGLFTEFPAEKVKPLNTTACGDSFNAGFIHEFLKTNDFQSALAKGTWCAARNAENLRPGSII